MKKLERLYIAVTPDLYELPIAVADTAKELAKMIGTSENSVYSCISKKRSGKKTKFKFLRIDY